MTYPGITLTATYDVRLVTLSIVIAVFGSYIALDLAGQVCVAQGWARKLWLTGGAIALGISIWAMHFIAMLAYQLPIPIAYDFRIVFVSMAVAIALAGVGLFMVNRRQPLQRLPLVSAAMSMGLAIVGLHLTAMAAMRVAAVSFYEPKLMFLSVATAIGGSGSALWLAFPSRLETLLTASARKIGSAILMATAIVGMHYLAMEAVNFQQTNQPEAQFSSTVNSARLAVTVGIATLIILILTLIASFFGQRSSAMLARAEALRQSEERFRSLVQNASDVIAIVAADCTVNYLSPSVKRILGYEPEASLGKKALELVHPEDVTLAESLYREAQRCPAVNLTNEFRLQHIDGAWRDFEVIINNLLPEPSVAGIVVTCRDITERKQAESQMLYNAFHDALTSLPNRALFMDRLERALNQAKRQEDYLFAVLFLDLDRFKVINDSLGHTFGDQFLIAIARRLTVCLRPTDTAARLGGDEFTILLEGIKDISDAVKVVDRIQAELRVPVVLGDQEVFTTASIGIAESATGYDRPSDLLRDADIAMYRAKALGKARYAIFNTDMHIRAVARLQLENDLRRAIEHQEFQIYYQPIVSLKTGKVTSFEALVRWQHPNRGLLAPQEFLSVLEETGLSVLLEQWVLRTACCQMRSMQLAFPAEPPLTICINFCSQYFAQPNLIEHIKAVLQETGLDAPSLKLEITERVIMENAESATALLLQLKALGIQLAIDDFGTGYSSLGRLHSFPINVLKIDRSFISDIKADAGNLEIVRTIVTLAHSLGMDVTAEGVETAEQLAQLRELNCEYGQGYFFSVPLDSEATEALIMAKPQW